MVAFVRARLMRGPQTPPGPDIFAEEFGDVQVALVTPVAGRLTHRSDSVSGGYFNLVQTQSWEAGEVVGWLDTEGPAQGVILGQFMMTGRRASPLARDGAGLLSGYFDRARAWRIDRAGPVGNLLSMGVCELAGVIQGEQINFLELLGAVQGPAHVTFVPDIPLSPSARVLTEQIRRTDRERLEIRQDVLSNLLNGSVAPSGPDWMFAGGLVKALEGSPINDRCDVIGPRGPQQLGPYDAILLSLRGEWSFSFRHRRLGYAFQCNSYLIYEAGPATKAWVSENFEQVRRTPDDVFQDYVELIDLVRAEAPATQFLICNRMSTSGYEDILSYAAFDAPLGDTVANVHDRELNLMLYDLARAKGIAIIDVDAIGADLGGRRFMPDRIHQDGAIQAAVRAEILRTLQARGVPGFGPPTIS